MARKRFTPEQIVVILREAERGAERKALFRKHGLEVVLRDLSQPPYVGYVLRRTRRQSPMREGFPYVADYQAELAQFTGEAKVNAFASLARDIRYRLMRVVRRS